jgi:hypothetical protein
MFIDIEYHIYSEMEDISNFINIQVFFIFHCHKIFLLQKDKVFLYFIILEGIH